MVTMNFAAIHPVPAFQMSSPINYQYRDRPQVHGGGVAGSRTHD